MGFLLHSDCLRVMEKKLTNSDPLIEPADKHSIYIFQFNDRYDIDGKTLRNKACYINHSCDPNCETLQTQHAIWIMAIRDIKAGEELMYNYGYGLDEYKKYPCTCGAEHCCGYILHPRYWERIQEK